MLTYVSEGEPEEDYQPRINKWVIASTTKRQPMDPKLYPQSLGYVEMRKEIGTKQKQSFVSYLSLTHFKISLVCVRIIQTQTRDILDTESK